MTNLTPAEAAAYERGRGDERADTVHFFVACAGRHQARCLTAPDPEDRAHAAALAKTATSFAHMILRGKPRDEAPRPGSDPWTPPDPMGAVEIPPEIQAEMAARTRAQEIANETGVPVVGLGG